MRRSCGKDPHKLPLCNEVHLNLAYRWFCRLGLEGQVPSRSTFSKNRRGRFRDSVLLRRLFECMLASCIAEGLVGGEGFAVDGSLIKADANRQKGVEGSAGLPPEAVSRAAQEYLAVLDKAAFGASTSVPPKFISPADPAARWTGAHGGQAFFAYTVNAMVGVLAIAIHTAGALGNLFAEVVEYINMKPVDSLTASDATPIEAIRFAVLPQVLSSFASCSLPRFEINVRGAGVMGFVGALQEFLVAIRNFYYSDVSASCSSSF